MEQVAALGAFRDVEQADDEAGTGGPQQGLHIGQVEGGRQARDGEVQGGEAGDPAAPRSLPRGRRRFRGGALGAQGGDGGLDGADGESGTRRVMGSQPGRSSSGASPWETAAEPWPST
ncbi:hypothetical protein GCM10020227_06550 [Streptomyces flavovirens]